MISTLIVHAKGDLFNNFCGYDPVANTARFLFACVIMLTFPIECFVAREVSKVTAMYTMGEMIVPFLISLGFGNLVVLFSKTVYRGDKNWMAEESKR